MHDASPVCLAATGYRLHAQAPMQAKRPGNMINRGPHLKTLAYCQPSGDVAVDTASSQPRWRASLGARLSATGLPSSLLHPGRSSRPGAALDGAMHSPQSGAGWKSSWNGLP